MPPRSPSPRSARGGRVGWRALAILLIGSALLAPAALAAGPIPVRIPDQAVYDLAGIFSDETEATAEQVVDSIRSMASADIVVVSESIDEGMSSDVAVVRAGSLLHAMGVGEGSAGGGLIVYFGIDPSGCHGQVQVFVDDTFAANVTSRDVTQAIFDESMKPFLVDCDLDSALLVALSRLASVVLGGEDPGFPTKPGGPAEPAFPAPGPPFPNPTVNVAVYDNAHIFQPETIGVVERTIDDIEARTKAEVVVYSQVVDYGISFSEANAHARALMDQWGVGRKGFDDGLVILFDIDPSLAHGQVVLFGGPGYLAAYLDNTEKQRIFDDDMLPRLRNADFDGALLVAIQEVDANATPDHAATLQRARQIDAAVGLIGAPMAFLGMVGSAVWSWRRYGRDPVYLDDPSVHMAGPPAELTPAAATFVLEGHASRRALTAALLDLASRGIIAFREESLIFRINRKVGIVLSPPDPDPQTRARQARNDARPLGPAERIAGDELAKLTSDDAGYVEPEELLKFGSSVAAFDRALEDHVVAKGWFREKPSAAVNRWRARSAIAGVLGVLALIGGINLPSGGLVLVGGALIAAALIVFVLAGSMPAVTLPGAMIRAMLAAYRRTLKKTMDQARSMDQVVAEAGLDWLETPDQAVVWATALGLHQEIETVMGRSLEDQREGRVPAGSVWLPTWYGSSSGGGAAGFAGAGSGGGGGLFSSSAVPDIGGMMSALGSIGNSPGGSGNGGGGSGGGFGGGGSGGGGGGSGGGF